jgi:hypothetical protein
LFFLPIKRDADMKQGAWLDPMWNCMMEP